MTALDIFADNEFSRPFDVTGIGHSGRGFTLRADETEMAALARRFKVLAVHDLMAQGRIVPRTKGIFQLEATFTATVVQACGLSLKPVTEHIAAAFSLRLCPPSDCTKEDEELGPDEEDWEELVAHQADVGELVAQHLALEIDPYPREKGATGEELGHKILQEEEVGARTKKQNPFDLLKTLKD